jgi:hypothetical protein
MDIGQDYEFVLEGASALLMHADDIIAADELDAWRKDPKHKSVSVAGDDRSPAWSWMTGLYSDGTHVAMPSYCVMASLRQAGAKVSARKGSFKSMSQSGLLISSDFCRLTNRGEPIAMGDILAFKNEPFSKHVAGARSLGFDLLVRRARIGKAKHVRVRPIFDHWRVSGLVKVLEPAITQDILAQLFDVAGRLVGLGDWRPGSPTSPGPYGMFTSTVKPVGKPARKAV